MTGTFSRLFHIDHIASLKSRLMELESCIEINRVHNNTTSSSPFPTYKNHMHTSSYPPIGMAITTDILLRASADIGDESTSESEERKERPPSSSSLEGSSSSTMMMMPAVVGGRKSARIVNSHSTNKRGSWEAKDEEVYAEEDWSFSDLSRPRALSEQTAEAAAAITKLSTSF
jgi:hypothetical protein